jgi:hypothetical protein
MKSTAAVEIEVLPKGGADTVVKNFKTQLKEAKNEAQLMVQTFGEFSAEALAAQKKVAELSDKMEDFNDRVKALNPDKFAKVQTVVQGISRGFQAGQGAMALFGAESEDLQKQLVKVQGAMALADGLEGLGKVQQQFKTLAKDGIQALVKSFSTLKGAIISTGIGVLVIALGYLIANFDKLGLSVKSDADKADDLAKSNDALKESMDLASKSIDAETDLLKAQGVSLDKINKLKIKGLEIANQQLEADTANIRVQQANLEHLTDLNYEMTKDEQEAFDKIEKIRKENEIAITKNSATILTLKEEVIKEGEDLEAKAAEKAEAKRKEQEALQKDARTKELKAIQDKNDALRKLDEANATEGLDLITTQYANNLSRLKEAKAAELSQENLTEKAIQSIKSKFATLIQTNEIDRLKAVDDLTKANNQKIIDNEQKNQDELKAAKEKFIAADLQQIKEQFQKEIDYVQERDAKLLDQTSTKEQIAAIELKSLQAQFDEKKRLGVLDLALAEQISQKKTEFTDKEIAEQQKVADTKQQLINDIYKGVGDSLNAISELNSAYAGQSEEEQKKAFEFDKALKYASTVLSTIEGAQSAFTTANKSPLTAVFPAYPFVQMGAAIAVGIANLKKISSTTYQSKSVDKTNPSQASGQGTMQSFAPRMSTLNTNDALTQNRKVFVTEGDITRTQRRVSNNQAISVVE